MPSSNESRFARCCIVAKDVIPNILRLLVTEEENHLSSNVLYGIVESNTEFLEKLASNEKQTLLSLNETGYEAIDFTLLYKLCRYYNLLKEPSNGWGNYPQPGEVNYGDEVERLRKLRNRVMRRPHPEVSPDEEQKFFTDVIEVASRIDSSLRPNGTNFESEIRRIQTCDVDEQTTANYAKYIEVQEQCLETIGRHRVSMYYGEDITSYFGGYRSGDEKIAMCLSCNENKEEIVRRLNELKEEINKLDCDIRLESAEIGSIVLNLKIRATTFSSKRNFEHTTLNFLTRIFHHVELFLDESVDVTISVSDCNLPESDDLSENEDEEESNPGSSGWLKLHVSVNNSVFRDEETFRSAMTDFITRVVNTIEDSSTSTRNSSFERPIRVIVRTASTPDISENAEKDRNIS